MGETGSGTAIGVAIIYPILMLVIMALAGLTQSSRAEQAVQAAANHAAVTASICCLYAGGPLGAAPTVEANLAAVQDGWRHSNVHCRNDVAADSETTFIDLGGDERLIDPGSADGGYSDPGDLYQVLPDGNFITRDVDNDPAAFDPAYVVVLQSDGTQLPARNPPPVRRPPGYQAGVDFEYLIDDPSGTAVYWGSGGLTSARAEAFSALDYPGVGERAAVPPGGLVQVVVECQVLQETLGGFRLPGVEVTQRAVGVATVGPYRQRFDLTG